MRGDRYHLALEWLLDGDEGVRRELAHWSVAPARWPDLVAQAGADGAAALAAGRPDAAAVVAALAQRTGIARLRRRTLPAPSAAGTDAAAARAKLEVTAAAMRRRGASLAAIAERTGRSAMTVRAAVARFEARTGTSVTPDRITRVNGSTYPTATRRRMTT